MKNQGSVSLPIPCNNTKTESTDNEMADREFKSLLLLSKRIQMSR
jgi:hypothetical protein